MAPGTTAVDVSGCIRPSDGRRAELLQHHAGLGERAPVLTAEFWHDFLFAAQGSGYMVPGLELEDVHLGQTNVGLMLTSLIERAPQDKDRHRQILRTFVLPALGLDSS